MNRVLQAVGLRTSAARTSGPVSRALPFVRAHDVQCTPAIGTMDAPKDFQILAEPEKVRDAMREEEKTMRAEIRSGKIDDLMKPKNWSPRYRELQKQFQSLVDDERKVLVKSEFGSQKPTPNNFYAMKKLSLTLLIPLVGFMSLPINAQVYSAGIPTFEVRMAAGKLANSNQNSVLTNTDIPDRPEKINFPPLKYEPPVADNFRVQLKSGPVAYIVPDHERPLVNLTLCIRTGTYLEPAGKEGLAELTCWLLTRGGAGTNSAEQLEERLALLAANLGANIGDTEGSVSLNLLAKDLDEGFGLLAMSCSRRNFKTTKSHSANRNCFRK